MTTAELTVLVDVVDRVAVLTLNRPEVLNALTLDMEYLLIDRIREADEDDDVGCIVLTGAGRGFCAGDDVKATWSDPRMAEGLARLGTPRGERSPFIDVMVRSVTPMIAAVNGPAMGIGMDFALLCDIRLAGPGARFSQAYARMGLVADLAGLWLLPRLVGPSRAAELLLTGDTVDAEEAARCGLVSRVVEDGLLDAAVELGGRVAAMPPLAAAATKELMRRAVGCSADGLDDLAAIRGVRLRDLFASADHAEAVAAFTEKRAAAFEGR